jgi:peroxiredoxin
MASAGDRAPGFSLASTNGDVRLTDLLRGGRVLLAFYFEDGTPACSAQLASLKDAHEALAAAGTQVVAVSADGLESHQAFAERCGGFPYVLASDSDLTVARAYGVVAEDDPRRSRRALFVIERDGVISYAANPYSPNSLAQFEEALRAAGVEL